MNLITDGIWLGAKRQARDTRPLLDRDISVIFRLDEPNNQDVRWNEKEFHVHRAYMGDGSYQEPGTWIRIADAIDDYVRHGHRIFVHCAAGRSRSVVAIMAYLIFIHDMSLHEAFETVRSRRKEACPHPVLIQSLLRDMKQDWRKQLTNPEHVAVMFAEKTREHFDSEPLEITPEMLKNSSLQLLIAKLAGILDESFTCPDEIKE